jgi:hypothetical protein
MKQDANITTSQMTGSQSSFTVVENTFHAMNVIKSTVAGVRNCGHKRNGTKKLYCAGPVNRS